MSEPIRKGLGVDNDLEAEIERLRVQLAGCSAASFGYFDDVKPGDYGYSASYDDVKALYEKYVAEKNKVPEASVPTPLPETSPQTEFNGYGWSLEEEGAGFSGNFLTPEAALENAHYEHPDTQFFYVGKRRIDLATVDFADVQQIFSEQDSTYEDQFEGWCSGVSPQAMEACSKELSEVFRKHLRLMGQVDRWEVYTDIKEYFLDLDGTWALASGSGDHGALDW